MTEVEEAIVTGLWERLREERDDLRLGRSSLEEYTGRVLFLLNVAGTVGKIIRKEITDGESSEFYTRLNGFTLACDELYAAAFAFEQWASNYKEADNA